MTRLQGGPSVVRFPAGAINCSVPCVLGTLAPGESRRDVKLTTPSCGSEFKNEWKYSPAHTVSYHRMDRDTVGFTNKTSQLPNQ